jgi:hypothetical protein
MGPYSHEHALLSSTFSNQVEISYPKTNTGEKPKILESNRQ